MYLSNLHHASLWMKGFALRHLSSQGYYYRAGFASLRSLTHSHLPRTGRIHSCSPRSFSKVGSGKRSSQRSLCICVSVGCARTSFDRKPRPGRLLVPLPVDALATKQMVRNSVQVNYATKHLTEETARKSIPPQIILKAKAHRAGISSHIWRRTQKRTRIVLFTK